MIKRRDFVFHKLIPEKKQKQRTLFDTAPSQKNDLGNADREGLLYYPKRQGTGKGAAAN